MMLTLTRLTSSDAKRMYNNSHGVDKTVLKCSGAAANLLQLYHRQTCSLSEKQKTRLSLGFLGCKPQSDYHARSLHRWAFVGKRARRVDATAPDGELEQDRALYILV
jgi:hypothetical protein